MHPNKAFKAFISFEMYNHPKQILKRLQTVSARVETIFI